MFHEILPAMDVQELIDDLDYALREAGAVCQELIEVEGFPIVSYELIREDAKGLVYISSGMHGDEPAGPLAILELVKEGLLSGDVSWVICPVLNPTGLAKGTRENFQGVDLNRDYLKKRTKEIQAHSSLLDSVSPDLAISLHEDWESTGFYFYEINLAEDKPQRYQRIVEAVSQALPVEPERVIDDHRVREPGWIYHENKPDEPELWPEAIYLAMGGCPLSLTFETPSSKGLETRVLAHKLAVKAALLKHM